MGFTSNLFSNPLHSNIARPYESKALLFVRLPLFCPSFGPPNVYLLMSFFHLLLLTDHFVLQIFHCISSYFTAFWPYSFVMCAQISFSCGIWPRLCESLHLAGLLTTVSAKTEYVCKIDAWKLVILLTGYLPVDCTHVAAASCCSALQLPSQ